MWILYIIGIYFGFYLIVQFFKWIVGLVEKRRQRIRDEVTNELFKNSDIENIIESCKKKLSNFSIFQEKEKPRPIPHWEWSRLPKYAKKIVNSTCPSCEKGYLKIDYFYNGFGRIASSFFCSRRPECGYKISLKNAKMEFKEENTAEFKKDFNRAYS